MENDDDEWEICWHVSPSVNRESIERHGLDWRRMGATGGDRARNDVDGSAP